MKKVYNSSRGLLNGLGRRGILNWSPKKHRLTRVISECAHLHLRTGSGRTLDVSKKHKFERKKSVWNHINIMGVSVAFKSESILPIYSPSRRVGYRKEDHVPTEWVTINYFRAKLTATYKLRSCNIMVLPSGESNVTAFRTAEDTACFLPGEQEVW
jgi:hypothetical protein